MREHPEDFGLSLKAYAIKNFDVDEWLRQEVEPEFNLEALELEYG